MKRRSPEHELQVLLVRWAALNARRLPELELFFAVPNGGDRNRVVAAKLKAEGVRAGVPDLVLPVARGQFHGLYLETKIEEQQPVERKSGEIRLRKRRTHPSPAQWWWIERLRSEGYSVEVYRSLDEGKELLEHYLTMIE